MTQKLTRLRVDEVSGVDKAANGKRFLILKAASPDNESTHPPLWRVREALRKVAGSSGPTMEVDEMGPEEIRKAIAEGAAEALAPMNERIEKLEAALTAEPVATEPVAKAEEVEPPAVPSAEDIAKMVSDGVTAALAPLAERIEKMEAVQGSRQSALDENGVHKVEKNAGGFWEGSGLLL